MKVNVSSEIGLLEAVLIHSPGAEVENMTPQNAERALYSDILNLAVANEEYDQFRKVLEKTTTTFELTDLLERITEIPEARQNLIKSVCRKETSLADRLSDLSGKELVRQLIQGVLIDRNNLTKYLSKERYDLRPLHNFFFTRDSSIIINGSVLISKMANKVRQREAEIMKSIFTYHPDLKSDIIGAILPR